LIIFERVRRQSRAPASLVCQEAAMWRSTAGLIAVALTAVPHTLAATCDEEIKRFAERYDLLSELPRAEPPSGAREPTTETRRVAPETLSKSGGVIEAPEQGRTVTIEPPLSGADVMPTRPKITPPATQAPRTTELSGAQRLQMQSFLNAARAAEREGKEAECFERLDEARSISERG
jgi:hypothetical protein